MGSGFRQATYAEWLELLNNCFILRASSYHGVTANGFYVFKAKSSLDKGKRQWTAGGAAPSGLDYNSARDAHIFLPDVARALGAECVIPPNAGVANAVGAVVGNISAEAEVELRPNHTADGIHGYFVCASDRQELVRERPKAVERCRALAEELAREEARRRGVVGDIRVTVEASDRVSVDSKGLSIDLGTRFVATAIGGAVL